MALKHGLLLVDTKYEFGKTSDGTIVLIDEVRCLLSTVIICSLALPQNYRCDGHPLFIFTILHRNFVRSPIVRSNLGLFFHRLDAFVALLRATYIKC